MRAADWGRFHDLEMGRTDGEEEGRTVEESEMRWTGEELDRGLRACVSGVAGNKGTAGRGGTGRVHSTAVELCL